RGERRGHGGVRRGDGRGHRHLRGGPAEPRRRGLRHGVAESSARGGRGGVPALGPGGGRRRPTVKSNQRLHHDRLSATMGCMPAPTDTDTTTNVIPSTIEREIVIEAPIDLVWRAVTEPDQIKAWFTDEAELDLRPGGEGRFTWDARAKGRPGTARISVE